MIIDISIPFITESFFHREGEGSIRNALLNNPFVFYTESNNVYECPNTSIACTASLNCKNTS